MWIEVQVISQVYFVICVHREKYIFTYITIYMIQRPVLAKGEEYIMFWASIMNFSEADIFCVFCEILSVVWWYIEIFWFIPNM